MRKNKKQAQLICSCCQDISTKGKVFSNGGVRMIGKTAICGACMEDLTFTEFLYILKKNEPVDLTVSYC